MTHPAFVLSAYALGLLIPAGFAVLASVRLRTARRRLAALEAR